MDNGGDSAQAFLEYLSENKDAREKLKNALLEEIVAAAYLTDPEQFCFTVQDLKAQIPHDPYSGARATGPDWHTDQLAGK
jgi:hypothetical protein